MSVHHKNDSNLELLGFLPKRPFHAYCLIGKKHDWTEAVESIAQALDIHLLDRYFSFSLDESISIRQVREFESFLRLQPAGRLKLAALNAEQLSKEAEHALLKSVEEPRGHTIVILLAEKQSAFLPALRSRCQIIRLNRKYGNGIGHMQKRTSPSLADCRTWSLVERFRFVETATKKGENILEMLDFWLENLYGTNRFDECSINLMRCLLDARKQLMANVQPRLVLEYIMLNID